MVLQHGDLSGLLIGHSVCCPQTSRRANRVARQHGHLSGVLIKTTDGPRVRPYRGVEGLCQTLSLQ